MSAGQAISSGAKTSVKWKPRSAKTCVNEERPLRTEQLREAADRAQRARGRLPRSTAAGADTLRIRIEPGGRGGSLDGRPLRLRQVHPKGACPAIDRLDGLTGAGWTQDRCWRHTWRHRDTRTRHPLASPCSLPTAAALFSSAARLAYRLSLPAASHPPPRLLASPRPATSPLATPLPSPSPLPSPQPPSPPPPLTAASLTAASLTAASLTATAPHRSLPHRHRPLPTSKGGPHRSHRRQPQVQPHGPRRRRLPGRSLHGTAARWRVRGGHLLRRAPRRRRALPGRRDGVQRAQRRGGHRPHPALALLAAGASAGGGRRAAAEMQPRSSREMRPREAGVLSLLCRCLRRLSRRAAARALRAQLCARVERRRWGGREVLGRPCPASPHTQPAS